eukprot:3262193-Amphidinium_carterae.1
MLGWDVPLARTGANGTITNVHKSGRRNVQGFGYRPGWPRIQSLTSLEEPPIHLGEKRHSRQLQDPRNLVQDQ